MDDRLVYKVTSRTRIEKVDQISLIIKMHFYLRVGNVAIAKGNIHPEDLVDADSSIPSWIPFTTVHTLNAVR